MNPSQANVWLAIYTMPRHEKKVNSHLQKRDINTFLPLTKQFRKWSDRIKSIETPLFPNYLFVNLSPAQKNKIYNTPGFIKFLGSNNNPTVVSNYEISLIKKLLDEDVELSNENFSIGVEVMITSGPLKGISGKIISKKGKDRLVIAVKSISKDLLVDVSPYRIEEISTLRSLPESH